MKFWREPNQWISGVALLFIGSLSLTSVVKGLKWILNKLLETQYLLSIGILVLVISAIVVIRKVLSFRTVPFENRSLLAKSSPTLYLLNWWRGKIFRKVHIEDVLAFFNIKDKRLYTLEYHDYLPEIGLTESRPTIIFRIPARSYMPISDFINLHLLHNLSIAGASVIVIVTDVLYSDKRIPENAIDLTMNICKKALGSYAKVKRLSTIFIDNSIDFTQFVVNNYASYLAENDQKLTTFKQPHENDISKILRANSFMSFGLFVFAIQKLIKDRDAVFVMQWRERISKWEDLLPLITRIPDLHVKGLIVNETLMDYNNKPILTGSHIHHKGSLFTMTDDPDFVASIIFKYKLVESVIQWEVPQSYVNWLNKAIFGIDENNKKSMKPNFYKIRSVLSFVKKFIKDQAVREEIDNKKWEEIYTRMRFYRKYKTSRSLFGKLYL